MCGRRRYFSSWIAWIVLALVESGCFVVAGQDSEIPMDFGAFQARREKLQQLLVLKNNGSSLGLNREWKTTDRSDQNDQLEQQIERLLAKGFNPQAAGKLARRSIPGGIGGHPIASLFAQLRGRNSSTGRTIIGNRIKMHFSDREMSGEMRIAESKISISLKEKRNPGREIFLSDDGAKSFSLVYRGSDFELKLEQDKNGSINVVRTLGDKTLSLQAENFTELQEKHLQFVKRWMIPALEHTGFVMPIAKSDMLVMKAVLEKLAFTQDRDANQFRRLIDDLSDDDFQIREQATATFQQQIDRWLDLANEALDSDSLTPEAFHRLSFIVNSSQIQDPVEKLIREQNLMNSPDYLVSLLDLATPAEIKLLIVQLQRVTGKDHSTPEAWKNFNLDLSP